MNAAGIRPFVPVMTVVVLIHCLLAFFIFKDLGAASLLLGPPTPRYAQFGDHRRLIARTRLHLLHQAGYFMASFLPARLFPQRARVP